MRNGQGFWIGCLMLVLILSGCTIHVDQDDGQTNQQTPPPTTSKKQSSGCLTLYEHINFEGKSKKICDSTPDLGKDFDNIISSVKADCDVQRFTLYGDKQFQGDAVGFFDMGCKNIPNLVNEHPPDPVNKNPMDGLNDWTSSIEIKKKEAE